MYRPLRNCPICQVPYVSLRQHLLKYHSVINKSELHLLLQYCSGIYRNRLHCPVCKAKDLKRLDRHLINVHNDITTSDHKKILLKAKQHANLEALKKLRTSNPQPPMVSLLDIQQLSGTESESEGSVTDECSERPSTSVSQSVTREKCRNCRRLKEKIRQVKIKLKYKVCVPPEKTRKKYERMGPGDEATVPRFEKLLRTWFQHISGQSKKDVENAKQRVQHVRAWAYFMSDKQVPSLTFSFLNNHERLIQWTDSLKHLAISTRTIRIGNVKCSLKFLQKA